MLQPDKRNSNLFAKLLCIAVLFFLLPLQSGCEAGEGAEGAEGAEGLAEASRGGAEVAEAARGIEPAEAAEVSGEALRAAEDATEGVSHFYARINENGLIYTIDEIGFRDEVIGRFNDQGELWAVRGELPVKMIAKVDEAGNLWEVNDLGSMTRVIGNIHVTITGSSVIQMYSSPVPDYSAPFRALSEGDVIEVIGRNQEWLQVKTADGSLGWIPASVVFQGGNERREQTQQPSGN